MWKMCRRKVQQQGLLIALASIRLLQVQVAGALEPGLSLPYLETREDLTARSKASGTIILAIPTTPITTRPMFPSLKLLRSDEVPLVHDRWLAALTASATPHCPQTRSRSFLSFKSKLEARGHSIHVSSLIWELYERYLSAS